MNQLQAAEQQLVGFAHASMGYSVKELVESMNMTIGEWLRLRDKTNLKQGDIKELNNYFSTPQPQSFTQP